MRAYRISARSSPALLVCSFRPLQSLLCPIAHLSGTATGSNGGSAESAPVPTAGSAVVSSASPSSQVVSSKARTNVAGDAGVAKDTHTARAGGTGRTVVPGKTKRPGTASIKVKRKAPWGAQQLRDSWSEDAMTKLDTGNMNERIHREYRYHPEEFRRHWLKYTMLATLPCIVASLFATYYYHTGRPLWEGDPQHILNMIRLPDTSPRSKLHAYKLEETMELPEHVLQYREANNWKRVREERLFKITHSAFQKPSEQDLRLYEMQLQSEESGDQLQATA